MQDQLVIYNTLSRTKEQFKPITPGTVGLYVCGPTVYSDVHLGNCRTFISFDLIFRYFLHLGYKVRYVRNITDAGHLEGDRDEGDDKFAKKAKIMQLEPMEIVQKYTVGFHDVMRELNNLPPSIEPTATGHICEQIEMIKQIIANGYAYEVNGTVYFDIDKYSQKFDYGELTNRKLEQLLEGTRELSGQDEKKGRLDFALWIAAKPETLMRWPSPWGWGFPGWHIECSAMSSKYLGDTFDIHGGGMDLQATHHTNEIAQSQACNHHSPANYWIHTNMLTVNGARMSKSAGNGFLPGELFTGDHPLLEKGYSPMSVRFFMMQTHYRSTLDFSNEALQASEKGYARLMAAVKTMETLKTGATSTSNIHELKQKCYDAMNDDFNAPILVANLFEGARIINSVNDGKESITAEDLKTLKTFMHAFIFDVLGLKSEQAGSLNDGVLNNVMDIILNMRQEIKSKKDFAAADKLRDDLKKNNITVKDTKDGAVWAIEGN
ncbi:MAG TPA: cysteine--tRNA ligase [Bacteroidia bacterium]|jgi:cysteinyl-tRNA synthetase|nr:cysteine--tRNA ligase [Bacteroidia bacterium]